MKVCIEEGDSILVTYRNTNSSAVDDVKGFPLDLFPKCHVASDASRFSRFLTCINYLKLGTDWTYY
jgi:hypothetical protein